MKRLSFCSFALAALLTVSVPVTAQITAVPQAMNFQGRLATPSGTPVPNGTYSIRFSLWDTLTGGTEKWNKTVANVQVKNGTFAVTLDGFPAGTFNGSLWLETKIGSDAPLTPRTPLVSVPYAMKSDIALTVPDGSITNAKLAGNITADKFSANIFNPIAWLLNGNSGTNPTTQFLGTTDNQPLNLRVNNQRAFRIEPVTSGTLRSINILGGSSNNLIDAGVFGATIAGGGYNDTANPAFPAPNRVGGEGGTVSGGAFNSAGTTGSTPQQRRYATVGGGFQNIAGETYDTIGGGLGNITRAGGQATIAGGHNNIAQFRAAIGGGFRNDATGDYSVIGGGFFNKATNIYTTVGGGAWNTASGRFATVSGGGDEGNGTIANTADGDWATVSGGLANHASGTASVISGGGSNTATGGDSTVLGGRSNLASGVAATVAGGSTNAARGDFSFAAGRRAVSNHTSTFVWADNTNADFISTGSQQFLIRAAGNVGINNNNPGHTLDVAGRSRIRGVSNAGGGVWLTKSSTPTTNISYLGRGNDTEDWTGVYSNSPINSGWHFVVLDTGNVGMGTTTPNERLQVGGNVRANNYLLNSDARYKQNIATFDNALETVLSLHGVMFDWRRDDYSDMNFAGGRQIGFIAQEVEKVLPELVMTDKSGYKSVNYVGVVPVLVEAVKTLKSENAELKAALKQLAERVNTIEANQQRQRKGGH